MALITRTYSFTDGTTAYGSQVDSEIANIVNILNNLDSAGATWTNVKVTTLLPQADVNAGGHKVTNLGTPTTSGDATIYPIGNSQMSAGAALANLASGDITQIQTSATAGTAGSNALTVTSKSITTTGGSVLVMGFVTVNQTATGTLGGIATIQRGSTNFSGNCCQVNTNGTTSTISGKTLFTIIAIDSPAAGTYTYNFFTDQSTATPTVVSYSLVLIELKK